MRRLRLPGALTVALALVTAAGCRGAVASAGKSPRHVTLVLYSGQHQQTTDALVQGFEARYPYVSVRVRDDDEDTFDNQIVTEGSRSPADVFYTENSPALEYLQQRGLLAKVAKSTLALTPARYNSPRGEL